MPNISNRNYRRIVRQPGLEVSEGDARARRRRAHGPGYPGLLLGRSVHSVLGVLRGRLEVDDLGFTDTLLVLRRRCVLGQRTHHRLEGGQVGVTWHQYP